MAAGSVITVHPHERVVLAEVKVTRLDTETAACLEDEVSQAIQETPALPLVLDFSKVRFVPSVALGVLVNLFRGMELAKRKAFLIGVNRQIRGAFAVTRLDALIDIRVSLAEVLARINTA